MKHFLMSVLLLAALAAVLYPLVQQGFSVASAQDAQSSNMLSVQLSLSANKLDMGQTITLNAAASGGTSPYTYTFFIYDSANSVIGANTLTSQGGTASFAWTANVPGGLHANVTVTDNSLSQQTALSNTVPFTVNTVNPPLAFNFISLGSDNITTGQSQTITANIAGGTSPYTYNFIVSNSISVVANALNAGSLTSNTFEFTQNAAWGTGIFTVNVIASDSAGKTVSNAITYNAIASTSSTTTSTTSTSTTSTSTTTSTTSTSTSISSTSTIPPPKAVFLENGLPNNALWNVSIQYMTENTIHSTTANNIINTIIFHIRPGNYSYTIPNQTVSSLTYVPFPSSGRTVTGNTTNVAFMPEYASYMYNGVSTTHVLDTPTNEIIIEPNGIAINSIKVYFIQPGLSFTVNAISQSTPFNGVNAMGNAYQYIKLSENQSIDQYIQSAIYSFYVPISALERNGLTSGNVKFFKSVSGSWVALSTTYAGTNGTDYFYSAVSNSLSTYAVGFVTGNSIGATSATNETTLAMQYNPVSYGVTDTITANAPYSTDTVEIMINGTVVATGTGTATYTVCSTAACLAGGKYNVTAEDTAIGPASSTSEILQVVVAPSAVLYYIPINFTNSQTTATPAPFQQSLTFNSLAYESYEAGNLSNIEFFYANGTIIRSWLESGNFTNGTLVDVYTQVSKLNQSVKTLYWLNLSKGIPASTTITVYMGFATHETNLFSNTITGEAPQLTSTYAQYDNGGKVFIDYWNFNGTALPPGWQASIPHGGAVTVDDGVTLQANTTSIGSIIYYEGLTSTNMIVDYYLSNNGGGFASGWTSGNPAGTEAISGTSSYALYSGYLGYSTFGQTGGIYLMQSGSETSVASPMAINKPEVFSFYWVDGAEHFWGNYGSEISATSTTVATAVTDTLYAGGDWYYVTNSAYKNTSYQWIRTRAYPPNGMMPTASVGSVQQVQGPPSLVISPNPITYGNLSTITLTGRPSTDTIELLINGKVVAGPSTGTITYTFNSVAPGYGAGSYTANALDENSLLSNVQTLTVNPATPKLSLATPYPSFLYNDTGGSISFDVSSINNQVTASLYVNGNSVATATTASTYITSPSVRTYIVEVTSAATPNYTAGVPIYSNFSIFSANVLYKVPITISNTQTIPTLKPFQYMLTANSLQYAQYEASNLDNILFTYANGTVLPSWLKSNDTTSSQASIYWLNILGGIPASSNVIVYMDFVSNAINMFNRTRGIGEAPQLSPTYGEYDSGFKVFPFYDDFQGNTLNASLWGSNVAIVDNGLNTSSNYTITSVKSFNFTNNYDFQVLGSIHEKSNVNEEDIDLVEPNGDSPYVVASNRNVSDTAGDYFIYTFINGAYTDGSAITSPYANTQYLFQINMSASDSTATIFDTSGHAVLYSSVYGTSTVDKGTSAVGAIRAVQIRHGYYDVYWTRVVTRPPNGVAPTAAFGTIEGIAQFSETGLPNSGESWSVTYGAVTENAIVPNSITFNEPVGSYSFTVPSVTIGTLTYAPTPSSGSLATGNYTTITFSSATCSISLAPNAINFGSMVPFTDIATTNSVVDTNSGASNAYIYVYGGNWIGSTNFGVSNTTWAASSGVAFPANRLTAAAYNTNILVPASSSNTIYFGLGVPGGAPSGPYT